jgi:uncharacterized membrane protein YecN with MAPEG domain
MIMNITSETVGFTSLLLLFGILALYGGAQWLVWLIPAAIAVWLIASARCHNRRDVIDQQAHNRAVGR